MVTISPACFSEMHTWFHILYSEEDKKHTNPGTPEQLGTPPIPTLSGAKHGDSRTLGRLLSF